MVEIALQKKLLTATGAMQLRVETAFAAGELVALYGHSGAGKTSILRMLAGLMKPDGGYIRVDGITWYEADRRLYVPVQQRRIGFVFQDYALFPNMNVRENITFGVQQPKDKRLVDELLELTGLTRFAGSPVQTLSGGQQQRVALARAIASKPTLLLLDEPLSAIDNTLRLQLQEMLLEVHRRFQLTTILISHDEGEITRLADRVLHLENGVIETYTNPSVFFDRSGSGLTGRVVHIGDQLGIFLKGPVPPAFVGESIAKHRHKKDIGAHSIFLGQVRDDLIDGKKVAGIEYSAYTEMALEQMAVIREEIFSAYGLTCLHIHHSLGLVRVGEISLFVFASSPHRRAAIDACNEVVERIKKELPVWGKEIFDDLSYTWKQNTHG